LQKNYKKGNLDKKEKVLKTEESAKKVLKFNSFYKGLNTHI